MPSREDWLVLAVLFGIIAVVGGAIYLSRKKASPQRIQLRKIGQSKIVYQNLEEHEIFEPEPGRIVVRIKRKVVKA